MSKKPNRTVYLVHKDTKVYTKVGVGWESVEGRLSLILNPGVVIDWRMCEDYYINVNDNDYQQSNSKVGNPDTDDIPF